MSVRLCECDLLNVVDRSRVADCDSVCDLDLRLVGVRNRAPVWELEAEPVPLMEWVLVPLGVGVAERLCDVELVGLIEDDVV